VNIGIALSGAAVYFVYIARNWSGFKLLPGGRTTALVLALLVFLALVGTRLILAYRQKGLDRALATGKSALRSPHTLATLIVAAALALRLWSINFGMPYLEQVDEWAVADRALHIIQTGNFDPLDYRNPGLPDDDRQAFTYPGLYTYLQTGIFSLQFLAGVTAGRYDGTGGLDSTAIKPDFYLWGRAFTALLGAATVLLVYVVGSRWYNRREGLLAALFLGFFTLHVVNSRFITTDVPSGFFALLPFLLILPILKGSENRWLFLSAGLLSGLAVGTKYNNALIFLPLVLAFMLSRAPRRWISWNLPLAAFGLLAGVFVTTPFAFFHLPNFLTDIAAIIDHYQNRGHAGYEGENNWLFYFRAMAQENLPVTILGTGGVVLALARHSKRDIVLLSFPLISYLQLSSYKVNFTRNLMPVLPFLAIFAALALVLLVEFGFSKVPSAYKRWQSAALALLGVMAIIGPAININQQANLNAQPSARARATTYIEKNLPAGSRFYIEPYSVELLPRDRYRVEGGSALKYPPEWYAANGYNYLVLSEAYHKESRETGKDSVKAAYNALIDGPRPAGLELEQDFPVNDTDKPGARIIILRTSLRTVTTNPQDFKIERPLRATLGSDIRLIGADFPDRIQPGKTLSVILYWETIAPPPRNYTVFVHLLDEKNKKVAQLDLQPLGATRPTLLWKPGEITRDEYPLALPANLAPGDYRLVVGMYLAPNGPRLTLPDGADSVDIGSVRVGAN
jgi:4-amino-4-deoxy-L-arabinose transferase-like glycosyltransferase